MDNSLLFYSERTDYSAQAEMKLFVEILLSGSIATVAVALIDLLKEIIKKKMDKDSVSLKDLKLAFDAHRSETNESISVLKRSQMETMRDRIKHICRAKITEGYITSDELEDLTALHTSYKELGGNGFCDKLMNKVNNLEIR